MLLLAYLLLLVPVRHSAASFAAAPADECIVLELVLPTADSMIATVPHPNCGAVRLSIAGAPQRVSLGPGYYQPERVFRIPVVLENVGTQTLRASLALGKDSAAPVQHGRQLAAFYSRSFFNFEVLGRTASGLRPGERSRADTLVVVTNPLAQGLRLWLNVEGARPTRPYEPQQERPSLDQGPPGPAIVQFVASSNLPKVRKTRVLLRLREQDLLIFETSYGEPQDCPAGCFYAGVLGLAYHGKIGWLRADQVDPVPSPFPLATTDTFLFSLAFEDTLAAHFGHGSYPEAAVYSLLLRHPDVPRSLLMRYTERLYSGIEQGLANPLARSPAVKRDPSVLTLLANLPNGGPPYISARETARASLRQLAPVLVHDATTTERTLFVVAQELIGQADSALAAAIAQHPKARSNPAILAVLAVHYGWARPIVLASVRATERVRRLVAAVLDDPSADAGRQLLDDPEAGANRDVMLVLANRAAQETAWAATRRLPEGALRRFEADYVPQR